MSRLKKVVFLILLVLGIIIVLQNTESVETKVLFITITMPRAILLFITTIAGFALGILVALARMKKT